MMLVSKILRRVDQLRGYSSCCLFHCTRLGLSAEEWNKIGEERELLLDGPRLVLHHQITEDAMNRLDLAFADSMGMKN